MGRITDLLAEAQDGRKEALDEVIELVYQDLRRIAARQLARRRGPDGSPVSLEPSELVNEAFIRLIKQRNHYDSRGHFFAIASRVMLRVLLDHQRRRGREKRGRNPVRLTFSQIEQETTRQPNVRIPDFVNAVQRLERMSPRTADVTKLRLLWGLTNPEVAGTLDVSLSTVEREWRFARRWLAVELFGVREIERLP